MEAFQAPGRRRLPEYPEDRLSGTLVCDDEGYLELKLIGAFGSVTNDVTLASGLTIRQPDGDTYTRLLGQSDSVLYTLDNCFRRKYDPLRSETSEQIIVVGQALRGAHFEAGQAFEFNTLAVRLAGMQYWVQRGTIGQSTTLAEDRTSGQRDQYSLTVEPMHPETFSAPGDLIVTLSQTTGWTGDGFIDKTLSKTSRSPSSPRSSSRLRP